MWKSASCPPEIKFTIARMGILLAANNRSFMQECTLAYVSQELRGCNQGWSVLFRLSGSRMALIYFYFLATYSIDEHLILLPEAPDWFLTAPQPSSSYASLSRNTVTPLPKIPSVRCCCVRCASSAALTCCRSWIALQKFDFIEAYPGLDDWVGRRFFGVASILLEDTWPSQLGFQIEN